MEKEDKKQLKKYIFLGVVFLLVFLSYLIIKPFFVAIISTFVLSYLLMPLYSRLNKKLSKTSSALICLLLVFLVLVIPLGALLNNVVGQANDSLTSENLDKVIERISTIGFIERLNIDLDSMIEKTISFIISLFGNALSYLPSIILTFVIVFFGLYYMLVNWELLSSELKEYLPFKDKKVILGRIDKTSRGLIYGTLLIAIIQFLVAVVGFYLSGVEYYFLLPSLIFFLAFIPGFGPIFVWVPMAVYHLLSNNYFTLIGVIITGVILTIFVDFILRARIVGSKAKINPFILLLGVLGGISLFGIFGFIIGPLILVYTIELIQEIIKHK